MTRLSVSMRISHDTKELVESLMRDERIGRSAALHKLLGMGIDEYRRRRALKALDEGRASFEEAAKLAGLTLWEFRELVGVRKVPWVVTDVATDVRRGLARESARGSPTRLKSLKEALKTRLSPGEWSSIFERTSRPHPPKSRTD